MKNAFRPRGCIFVTISGVTRVRYASKTAGEKLSDNRTELARSLSSQVRAAVPLLSASSLVQACPVSGPFTLVREQRRPPRRISIAKLINPSSVFPGGHPPETLRIPYTPEANYYPWLLSSSFPHLQRTVTMKRKKKEREVRGERRKSEQERKKTKKKRKEEKGKRKRVAARRGRGRMDERRDGAMGRRMEEGGWRMVGSADGSGQRSRGSPRGKFIP